MNPLILYLTLTTNALRTRWNRLRADPERGSTPEQTALIALLVVMAVTVVGIISAKVIGAANGINLP